MKVKMPTNIFLTGLPLDFYSAFSSITADGDFYRIAAINIYFGQVFYSYSYSKCSYVISPTTSLATFHPLAF
jgi:hypothetical protein